MKGMRNIFFRRWRGLVIYTPLIFGLIMLLYLRSQGNLEYNGTLSIALLLMACPCLFYSVLPGVGQVSPDQVAILNQLGIRYNPWMGRAGNAAIGLILLAFSIISLTA